LRFQGSRRRFYSTKSLCCSSLSGNSLRKLTEKCISKSREFLADYREFHPQTLSDTVFGTQVGSNRGHATPDRGETERLFPGPAFRKNRRLRGLATPDSCDWSNELFPSSLHSKAHRGWPIAKKHDVLGGAPRITAYSATDARCKTSLV
jgi:hypothetical protein